MTLDVVRAAVRTFWACFGPVAFYYEGLCLICGSGGGAGVHVIALWFPPVLSVEIAQLPTLCPLCRSLHGIECDLT